MYPTSKQPTHNCRKTIIQCKAFWCICDEHNIWSFTFVWDFAPCSFILASKEIAPRNNRIVYIEEVFRAWFECISRFSEDWCLDVIVQPLRHSKLFSKPDSVFLLCNNFEVYHSLLGLLSPFYWYKSYDQSKLVEALLSSYCSTNMCFISKDLPPLVHTTADGKNEKFWEILYGMRRLNFSPAASLLTILFFC